MVRKKQLQKAEILYVSVVMGILLSIFPQMVFAVSGDTVQIKSQPLKASSSLTRRPLTQPKAVQAQPTTNVPETKSKEEDNYVYNMVEEMPEFTGGQRAMMSYLSERTKGIATAKIQGRVVCQFIVHKDGSISDVNVTRSSGYELLDAKAIQILQSMPKWTPGKQNGNAVNVRYTQSVTFQVK